jgi:hypothetical protein
MGWTVTLEDERRKIISKLSNEFEEQDFPENEYKRLPYLDPYGDAKFNHRQMPDLINDLNKLKKTQDKSQIDKIIGLAVK